MIFREAKVDDIVQIKTVRNAVKENTLSDPNLITDKDIKEYLISRGKGWVCKYHDKIVGFAIVDLVENSVWALFLLPEYEKQGIGRKLQELMLGWYFGQTQSKIELGTSPDTRAENFYRKSGWTETGKKDNGEIKFEMSYGQWLNLF